MRNKAPFIRFIAALALPAMLAACQGQGKGVPGDADDTRPYAGISESEVLRFGGTEPFWGGEVRGARLTWTTPETPSGTAIAVKRFAGRNGVGFTGTLDGKSFDMTVTPDPQCSDGMSDRRYPFNVTVRIGEETRSGCAWSDAHPFTGPQAP